MRDPGGKSNAGDGPSPPIEADVASAPTMPDVDSVDPEGHTISGDSDTGSSDGRSRPHARAGGTSYRRGDRIDRFVILERLGVGGMSVVLSAYDPGLDRRVAIKVLRSEMWRAAGVRGRDRLLREAQAMARLSHPNVVTVHEVGESGEKVFIAMEQVAGQTLREWIRAPDRKRRSWREITAMFVQAGRGLAAAHHAGLVHRDFKPENVLIGDDGRVRVTDFGLVSTSGATDSTTHDSIGDDEASFDDDLRTPTPVPMSVSLTRTGAFMGTPAYMAPEQERGATVDGRADQFAFCVSLWEALYGVRPFAGETPSEVLAAVAAGRVREPPPAARAAVPPWLHAVLVRGLAHDPDRRWPSMDELLDRLASDPEAAANQRRRRVVLGVLITALIAIAAVALVRGPSKSARMCEGARAELDSVWNGVVRFEIAGRFGATGRSYAVDTFARAARLLDAYAAGWVHMRTEACEATHMDGRQSAATLDLRMRCLDRARAALRARTELWTAEISGEVVDRAIDAVTSLPPLEACADVEALGAAIAPPASPAARQRADAIAEELDRIEALASAGRFHDALPRAKAAVEQARLLDYPPLLARCLHVLGIQQHELADDKQAAETLREAIHVAARARDDERAARAWFALGAALSGQGREEEALAQRTAIEAAVARAGNGDLLRAEMWSQLGTVLWNLGRYTDARDYHERALALREQKLGRDDPQVAESLESLGNVLADQGSVADARPRLERAVAIREKALGPRHPRTASARNDLGMLLRDLGDPETALVNFELALSVQEETLGPEHADVGRILNNVGLALADQNKNAEAEPVFRRALAIKEKALGAEHPSTALTLSNLGVVLIELGEGAAARPFLERAFAIYRASSGESHPNLALPHHALGAALRLEGRCVEAIPHFLAAKAIWEKALGADRYEVSSALFDLGVCQTDLGHPQAAIPLLEQAVTLRDKHRRNGGGTAEARWQLGRALWESGRDRKRGLALVQEARPKLAGLRQEREIAAWLATHAR